MKSDSSKIAVKKRSYAQSPTKLCEKQAENRPYECSRRAKAETCSLSRSLSACHAPSGWWAPAAGWCHAALRAQLRGHGRETGASRLQESRSLGGAVRRGRELGWPQKCTHRQ